MKEKLALNAILLENSPNPLLIIGKDTSILFVNSALEKLTGYSSKELLGRKAPYPWWYLTDIEEQTYDIHEILSHGEKWERCNHKKNGELFWVEITSKKIEIDGKFKFFLSTWLDITKYKKAEKALLESEEFNSSLLRNAPNPVLVVNQDTSIRYVNPALENLTGYSSEELTGIKAPYPWFSEEDICTYPLNMTRVMLSGEVIECRHKTKIGKEIWVQIASKAVVVNREIKYFITNWVDITVNKKAEVDRCKLNGELSKLNEELRNLSAHLQSVREKERAQISREVHDEFGQALAALKMDACWIEENLGEKQEGLHKVTESMLQLIEITLQKVKWLSVGLRPRLLDDIGLKEAITWLAREFQSLTGITCSVTITTENNSLSEDCSTAVFRILQEALTNVFRHARATRVTISLRPKSGDVLLRINDNGRGITREQINDPKAFGLIGMSERACFLGGDLNITGKTNRGTTVLARIPITGRK